MRKLIIAAAFLPLTAFAGSIPVVNTESTTVPPVIVSPSAMGAPVPPPAVVQQVNSAIQTFTPQGLESLPTPQLQQIRGLIDSILPAAEAGTTDGISPGQLRALRERVQTALNNS